MSLAGLLAVAVPLGMLHALDADHLVAVSSLGAARPGGAPRSLVYSFRWAMGHGGLLIIVAISALLFHRTMPAMLPGWAERAVGVVLIGTGALALRQLYLDRLGKVAHRHGVVEHAHHLGRRGHDHAPMAIGMLHGLAGSAPAMALIPATLLHPALGLAYVLVFSIGVLIGMLCFGLCLRRTQGLLLDHSPLLADAGRMALGLAAIALGLFWLAVE